MHRSDLRQWADREPTRLAVEHGGRPLVWREQRQPVLSEGSCGPQLAAGRNRGGRAPVAQPKYPGPIIAIATSIDHVHEPIEIDDLDEIVELLIVDVVGHGDSVPGHRLVKRCRRFLSPRAGQDRYRGSAMSRVVDAIAPPRFGDGFRRLLMSSWAGDIGDGVALAAGPLLVVSQTRDPFLIALATLLQRLPWLVFGLYAGVCADRYDRRRIIVIGNSVRAVVLVALSALIVTDAVSVTAILLAVTLLGSAEVFVDTTGHTMLPMLVDKDDLGVANSRLMFGRITLNRLGGPALGALLFAAGMAVPFVLQGVCVAFAALIVRSIVIDRPAQTSERSSAIGEIKEGLRWVWHHAAIRTLTITTFAFNITFGAVWAILVLYSVERLGLGAIGFGLLTSFGAAGGVLVAVTYGRIERRLGMANIMRIGLSIEVLMHLTFAINSTPWIAFAMFFIFGMHEAAWGTTSTTIRQRVVPEEFQGRVSSVTGVGVFSTLVLGALLGGVIASKWGVTGPFWFGFVGSLITLIAIWRQLANVARAD